MTARRRRMPGRRLVLATAAAGALGGCGFRPLYMPTSGGRPGVAQRELAAISVALIPDRPGQLLRQALQSRFEGAVAGEARRYDLSVSYGIAGEGIAVQSDSTATRIRLIARADWALYSQDPARTRLATGNARAIDSLNIFDSQYFAADLQTESVQRRLAEATADQITTQLAVYFRRRADAAAAAQG